MLETRVIPCLLLRNRGLVKTVKFKNPHYVGDPVNTIRIFSEKEVDELIFLDITATVENRKPFFSLISEVASECFMPLTYGGGITTLDDARTIFSLGVEKIAINSHACSDPRFVRELSDAFGSQSIIVSIDVKKTIFGKYAVCSASGTQTIKDDPVSWAKQMQEMGAGEILLNSIDRDGTYEGYDTHLIRDVAGAVTIPLIACGGAGTITDFRDAVLSGASAVAAGSMVVYQAKGKGVLINFPARRELEAVLPAAGERGN